MLYRRRVLLVVVALIVWCSSVAIVSAETFTPPLSLDGVWHLRHDPDNTGKERQWWDVQNAPSEYVDVTVPGIAQLALPGKRGVFWYDKAFVAPNNPYPAGRTVLKFLQADYFVEVWLNGTKVGEHEGGEGTFEFDVTDAIRHGADNRLVVRIINPINTPIDGFVLQEVPHRNRTEFIAPGADFSHGGITDSVELHITPAVRVQDIFARPDWATGNIHIQTTAAGKLDSEKTGMLSISVAPANGGETLLHHTERVAFSASKSVYHSVVKLDNYELWDLANPFLYRVTVRFQETSTSGFSEQSTRSGFRDFRFENGAFHLNGRRIYLKCSHSGADTPIGCRVPLDRSIIRKDVIHCKTMGFNMIRYISGMPPRFLLDQCDELGMLVYDESLAGWCLAPSPHQERRFLNSTRDLIMRDRNHPSVVAWGLLNEMTEMGILLTALKALPFVRALDDSRLIFQHSGGWDYMLGENWKPLEHFSSFGRLSNPGSHEWEDVMEDRHPYQPLPHTEPILQTLRTYTGNNKSLPLFLSEYGMGSAVNLFRIARQYEQHGHIDAEDAVYYRNWLERFMNDWKRCELDDTFADPDDYFRQAIEWMADLRLLGTNAIRANPFVIGYSVTGTHDQGFSGEGLTTIFRELKPGTTDAMADAFAPLRWCLFVDRWQNYRGDTAKFEVILANEDILKPGEYPVRIQVIGPKNIRLFDRMISLTIPKSVDGKYPPFALPVFSEEIKLDGPGGKYRFLATLQEGGAVAGKPLEFFVTDPSEMPKVDAEVTLWGDDAGLNEWLQSHEIATKPFEAKPLTNSPEVILVGCERGESFDDLLAQVHGGSCAIFIVPGVPDQCDEQAAKEVFAERGNVTGIYNWLYHADYWTKNHPYFVGLPRGGIMNHAFYRNMIGGEIWADHRILPDEIAAGAIDTSCNYRAGLTMCVYQYGKGRIVFNSLKIRDQLGIDPVAEIVLRNMLRHENSVLVP